MITQLDPPIPVTTTKGCGLAHALIDDGLEHDLKWICFIDSTGECWTFRNRDVRAQKNITQGRDYISPFYDPDDVSFKKKPERCSIDEIFCLKDEIDDLNKENNNLKTRIRDLQFVNKTYKDYLERDLEIKSGKMCVTDAFFENYNTRQDEEIHKCCIGEFTCHYLGNVLTLTCQEEGRDSIHTLVKMCPFCGYKTQEKNAETKFQSEACPCQVCSNNNHIPDFEELAKPDASIVDNHFQKKIEEVAGKLRGNELKILDDFCQAYYAAKMHMTGKDFMSIADEVCLSIQQFYKDGQVGTRYWFDLKKDIKNETTRSN